MVDYACQYIYTVFPFLVFYFISRCYTTFCFASKVFKYGFAGTAGSGLFHVLMVLTLCKGFGLGFTGICLSSVSMYLVRFLINVLLTYYGSKIPKVNSETNFFNKNTITDLKPQFILGLKATAMTIWQWWAADIFTIIASTLGSDVLAAQTCLRTMSLLAIMIPIGLEIG